MVYSVHLMYLQLSSLQLDSEGTWTHLHIPVPTYTLIQSKNKIFLKTEE